MARIIETHNLTPTSLTHSQEKHLVYNGLDCCVTLEVMHALRPLFDPTTLATYQRSLDLQGPILFMNMKGTLVDRNEVLKTIRAYEADINRLRSALDRILKEGVGFLDPWFGKGGSPSPLVLKRLFYDVMKLPPVKKRNDKGGYSPTVNREALEKLRAYLIAEPIVNYILAMRDLGKKIGFLRTEIDRDDRIRTSFNIAGTITGRLASSMSDFGTGTNLQNIDRRLRRVFIADPGRKFANVDLEQADARNVGLICAHLFGDTRYLDACESGDLHTTVCKMAWAELPWPGDPRGDRHLADRIAYRDLSYRDLAKKLGHGTNYLGTPATMAKHTKVDAPTIAGFQMKYFGAFPAIQKWHLWVRQQLLQSGQLTTPYGRRRHFFGRRDDDNVVREAVAYAPQSMTAEQVNLAMLHVFRQYPWIELLIQVHDSLLCQFPEAREAAALAALKEAFQQHSITIADRTFLVPSEAKVGWNWADVEYNKQGQVVGNPDGLAKCKTLDTRSRRPPIGLMDRVLC
jgi:DNA polymerase I-like protein with 3'-5' exonuclease and polymerase domains